MAEGWRGGNVPEEDLMPNTKIVPDETIVTCEVPRLTGEGRRTLTQPVATLVRIGAVGALLTLEATKLPAEWWNDERQRQALRRALRRG